MITIKEIINPIKTPIILMCSLKNNHNTHAITATKYLQVLPVDICVVSLCIDLAK